MSPTDLLPQRSLFPDVIWKQTHILSVGWNQKTSAAKSQQAPSTLIHTTSRSRRTYFPNAPGAAAAASLPGPFTRTRKGFGPFGAGFLCVRSPSITEMLQHHRGWCTAPASTHGKKENPMAKKKTACSLKGWTQRWDAHKTLTAITNYTKDFFSLMLIHLTDL